MHHVIVFDEHQRRKGHGTRMIANVRKILPRGNNLGRYVGSFEALSGKQWWTRNTLISLATTTLGLVLIRIVSFVIRTESTA
jgi:hypothetical protein